MDFSFLNQTKAAYVDIIAEKHLLENYNEKVGENSRQYFLVGNADDHDEEYADEKDKYDEGQ